MYSAELIKNINEVRVSLLDCTTLEEINKTFSELQIDDYFLKAELLRFCMAGQKIVANTNDEASYRNYLEIFLAGKWRDTNLVKETPMSDSNYLDGNAKNIIKGNKTKLYKNEISENFNVSNNDYKKIKEFYERYILPNIQKKYLSQLISVVEDLIEEKRRNKKFKTEETIRYRIMLSEFSSSQRMTRASCLVFPNHAVIFYDPKTEKKDIRFLIAHELGHLLYYYGIITGKDAEDHANLFTFFVINGEKDLFTQEQSPVFLSKEETIDRIKILFYNK